MINSDSEWLSISQACEHCLTQHAKLQVVDRPESNKYVSISEWMAFQSLVQTEFLPRLMPVVDCDPQLRSLVPEVVRLMKLLQIDWQFWQAARQSEKQAARQQQFFHHFTQLGQLLSALQHRLEGHAGLKKC